MYAVASSRSPPAFSRRHNLRKTSCAASFASSKLRRRNERKLRTFLICDRKRVPTIDASSRERLLSAARGTATRVGDGAALSGREGRRPFMCEIDWHTDRPLNGT